MKLTKQQLESGTEFKKVLRERVIKAANIANTAMLSSHEIDDAAFYNGRRDAYRRIISSIDYISEKSHIAKPFVGKLIHHLQGVREQTVMVLERRMVTAVWGYLTRHWKTSTECTEACSRIAGKNPQPSAKRRRVFCSYLRVSRWFRIIHLAESGGVSCPEEYGVSSK